MGSCYLDNELDHGSDNIDSPSYAVLITARTKFFPKNCPAPAGAAIKRKVGLSVFQSPGHCQVVQMVGSNHESGDLEGIYKDITRNTV